MKDRAFKKDLARGEAPVKLDSTKSAVEKIVKQNRSGTPTVTVSYTRLKNDSAAMFYTLRLTY